MNVEESFIPGKKVLDFFIVNKINVKYKKNGIDYYLQFVLSSKSDKIKANLWNNPDKYKEVIKPGDIVKIKGVVELFNNEKFIQINRIRLKNDDDSITAADLLPKYSGDLKVIEDEFDKLLNTVKDDFLSSLLKSVFCDEKFYIKFREAPAGKKWHHNYIHGLIEHTLSMVKTADKICEVYVDIDRDLLLTGTFFHDIGKVFEYSRSTIIDYSDEGRLIGHLNIGHNFLSKKIENIENFPNVLKNKVLHMILSHHGEYEKGSPVLPMFKEALILYYLDEIDSKLNAFNRIITSEKKEDVKWSNYVNLINRFIFFD